MAAPAVYLGGGWTMSAKYSQHPREAKAEADIAATRIERARIDAAYERWTKFYYQSTNVIPFPDQAFRAGWIEAMDEVKRTGESRGTKP